VLDMFLSRLVLNVRSLRALADLADSQALHRTVMTGFGFVPGDAARDRLEVLTRAEERPIALLVSSAVEPDWSHLPADYLAAPAQVREMDTALAAIVPGLRLRFRLVAAPVRALASDGAGVDGRRARGRKIPITDTTAAAAWLRRRLGEAGAEVEVLSDVTRLGPVRGTRDGEGEVIHRGFRFDGTLVVRNPDLLRAAMTEGIGPGKAYGMGLLSVARG
jgi:CRISPR system Cascade subunit CasE